VSFFDEWAWLTERMDENLFLEFGEPTNTELLRACELALLGRGERLEQIRNKRRTWFGSKEHRLRRLADALSKSGAERRAEGATSARRNVDHGSSADATEGTSETSVSVLTLVADRKAGRA